MTSEHLAQEASDFPYKEPSPSKNQRPPAQSASSAFRSWVNSIPFSAYTSPPYFGFMENETQPDQNHNELSGLTTGRLLILSVVSANIYVFFSFLIIRYWHEGGLNEVFKSTFSVWEQLGIGMGTGCVAAGIVFIIISLPPVSKVLSDFTIFEVLSKANFSFFDKTQVSLFAGAGEELLFRGAIQPLLGNTLTSIIFTGIHGYFKFKSPGHILFGVMMFGLSFMLGFLFEEVGLISAMSAHAVYDLVMLQAIQRKKSVSG